MDLAMQYEAGQAQMRRERGIAEPQIDPLQHLTSLAEAETHVPLSDRDAPPIPPRRAERRIAILTSLTHDVVEQYNLPSQTKSCYAALHGYHFVLDLVNGHEHADRYGLKFGHRLMNSGKRRVITWLKIGSLHKFLPYYDWVVWMDGDAIIKNFTVRLEQFIEPAEAAGADLIMADHLREFQTGVFFFRNSRWTARLLEAWWVEGKTEFNWAEQGALTNLIIKLASVASTSTNTHRPYHPECSLVDHSLRSGLEYQACTQRWMALYGHPYRNRTIPHIHFYDPHGEVPGGFATFLEPLNWREHPYFGGWDPIAFYQPGNFILQLDDKPNLHRYINFEQVIECFPHMEPYHWNAWWDLEQTKR